ncbi:hypothetical protein GCM10025768_07150 [Microbacterium pseudoresistens]|uniref:Protein-disulfide isomerase n=1 Tax=Microbacterium pseudoresistens TaxID=640634 RepID=A0A7Y9EV74_9MICO|nr:thioredoxin domain-containing protein [Microbacterium pseudoresistens]NYD54552.1 protein-disulfide isomerase [Microbacterium pseudoresistens]
MAAAKGRTNWFAIIVSAAVVVVLLGLGGVVVWLNNAATDPGPAPQAGVVDTDTGAITFGTGDTTIETYVDFMCPACNAFEQTHGEDLWSLAESNKITLKVTPVAALDRFSQGTAYSTRAGNALYCVAEKDESAIVPFITGLFAQQPEENSTGLDDATLIEIAKGVGVTGIDSCITDRTYGKFMTKTTSLLPASPADGQRYTPAVLVDGGYVENPVNSPDFAKQLVDLGK